MDAPTEEVKTATVFVTSATVSLLTLGLMLIPRPIATAVMPSVSVGRIVEWPEVLLFQERELVSVPVAHATTLGSGTPPPKVAALASRTATMALSLPVPLRAALALAMPEPIGW